jgi:hypothetical protein
MVCIETFAGTWRDSSPQRFRVPVVPRRRGVEVIPTPRSRLPERTEAAPNPDASQGSTVHVHTRPSEGMLTRPLITLEVGMNLRSK